MKLCRLFVFMVAAFGMLNASVSGDDIISPPTFTYQGELRQGGLPVTGDCELKFELFDMAVGGSQIGPTNGPMTVTVIDGIFTAQLDFGVDPAFCGQRRWLEISVCCPSPCAVGGPLAPRQELTPSPYALALPALKNTASADAGFPGSPNLIGGHHDNSIGAGSAGAVVVGGGAAGAMNNSASGLFPVVSGGLNNTATGNTSTVSGGSTNTASMQHATVAGGFLNAASGKQSTIGGGGQNNASGPSSTVGGGINNTASGIQSSIGGGTTNIASGASSTVGGGHTNTASGIQSTVGGGIINVASGLTSTVPGGVANEAVGESSFAAGRQAKANFDGMFVWGDNIGRLNFPSATEANFVPAANQFLVRAGGGVVFVSSVNGAGDSVTGVQLAAGGGAWAALSDRNVKENVKRVDEREVLERLSKIPVSAWNYKSQDESIRHIGPMAQDLYAAFKVGENEKMITTVDADGVALAAIQGLHQIVKEKDAQITALGARLAALEAMIAAQAKAK
ncbi:MAG: tail fiber domain-containing protein [Phycisphaerales bacterium]|nr:tail fiber domain-containing protein [Phycisphaerales bacterium]